MNKFLQVIVEARAEKSRRELRSAKAAEEKRRHTEAWLAMFPEHVDKAADDAPVGTRKTHKYHDDPEAKEIWRQKLSVAGKERWARRRAAEGKEQQDG
jgi:hypothetical protein